MTKIIITILFTFFSIPEIWAKDNYISLDKLKKNSVNKVIFLRHSLAPGNGDPLNFNVNDCSTQRNLDQVGIAQSRMIGRTFNELDIKFSKIYSSNWCRCKDTVINMEVGKFKTHMGLNSFYERHADKEATLRKLNNLIKSLNSSDGPYLLVTHYVNILAFTGLSTSSGGMVAYNLNTKVSTQVKLNN